MNDTVPAPAGDVLPPRARLLHIGLPKTGTTALQGAAASNRAALLEHGVRYPGSSVSHRWEVAGLMGRGKIRTADGPVAPKRAAWATLRAEIDADTERRVLVSHEYAAASTDEQARQFRAELGDGLFVAVTVRNYADMLGSRWQQYVKAGLALSLDAWLTGVLGEPPDPAVTPRFHDNSDQGAIVARWCQVVGPERLTVVVADKSKPWQLAEAFGRMLDVPADLLRSRSGGGATNRSLSAAEAELIRALNEIARADPELWKRHHDLVRSGVISRLQGGRTPAPGEPVLRLPQWAAERAEDIGRRHADQIAATGCRVVGDLTQLHAPVTAVSEVSTPDHVPLDAALQALVGMMRAGVRPRPREAVGRQLRPAEPRQRSKLGSQLNRVLPAQHVPASLRRQIRFVRRIRRPRSSG